MKSIFKLLYDLQENLNQRIHNVSGRNLKLKNTMRLLFFFQDSSVLENDNSCDNYELM